MRNKQEISIIRKKMSIWSKIKQYISILSNLAEEQKERSYISDQGEKYIRISGYGKF